MAAPFTRSCENPWIFEFLTNSKSCFPKVAKKLLITLIKVLVIPRIRLRSATGILFALMPGWKLTSPFVTRRRKGPSMLEGKIKGTITVPPLVPPVSRRSLRGTKPPRIGTREDERERERLAQRPVGLKRGPAINTSYALELLIMLLALLVVIYLWTTSEGMVLQIVRWLSRP